MMGIGVELEVYVDFSRDEDGNGNGNGLRGLFGFLARGLGFLVPCLLTCHLPFLSVAVVQSTIICFFLLACHSILLGRSFFTFLFAPQRMPDYALADSNSNRQPVCFLKWACESRRVLLVHRNFDCIVFKS